MSQFDGDPDKTYLGLVANTLFGVALFIGSPFLIYHAWQQISEGGESRSWQETQVEITQSEVIRTNDAKVRYRPIVKYTFEFQGETRTGDRIAVRGLDTPNKSSAEGWSQKYPVGSKHTAYVNPVNPEQAVLETGTHWTNYLMLLIALLVLPAGFFMVKENALALKVKWERGSRKKSKRKRRSPNPRSPGPPKPRRRRPQ